MKLDTPTLVAMILGQQHLPYGTVQRVLQTCVFAHFASENLNRITRLSHRLVIPSLDGGEAEAHRLTGDRMTPGAGGELFELCAQLTFRRRRGQQLAHYRETHRRPAL